MCVCEREFVVVCAYDRVCVVNWLGVFPAFGRRRRRRRATPPLFVSIVASLWTNWIPMKVKCEPGKRHCQSSVAWRTKRLRHRKACK